MNTEVEKSVAFSALSKPGRRAYALLAGEIASSRTGSVAITSNEMMGALNLSSSSSVAGSIRELKALGLISVSRGERCIGAYALADGWQAIVDLEQAKATASAARLPPKRKPRTRASVERKPKRVEVQADAVEVEAEPAPGGPRPISLPVLPWPTPAGLRLLAETL